MGKMTKDELLIFVEQIYISNHGNRAGSKAEYIMQELIHILAEEGTEGELLSLAKKLAGLTTELRNAATANGWKLSDAEIQILEERKKQRLIWEEEARRHGRC